MLTTNLEKLQQRMMSFETHHLNLFSYKNSLLIDT